jgi:hypothetical protein
MDRSCYSTLIVTAYHQVEYLQASFYACNARTEQQRISVAHVRIARNKQFGLLSVLFRICITVSDRFELTTTAPK